MIMAVKKLKKNNEGQSLIEFIVFLPIVTILLVILLNIGSSINGAINQQKITRSYFFSRVKGNSMIPYEKENFEVFGMFHIGWAEIMKGEQPVLPCYDLSLNILSDENDETDCKNYTGDSTQFIRVGTVFGMCGATYIRTSGDNKVWRLPAFTGQYVEEYITLQASAEGCFLR